LGDDLDAALDARAPSYWGGPKTPWPRPGPRARALAPLVKAPPELAARLAFTAVVARADGERLAGKDLCAGMRLVSREGDLWRWDGFVARADAPKPAAVRLEQRTRLAEVEAEIDVLRPARRGHRRRPEDRRPTRLRVAEEPCATSAGVRRTPSA
jgi:chromosome segregation protein